MFYCITNYSIEQPPKRAVWADQEAYDWRTRGANANTEFGEAMPTTGVGKNRVRNTTSEIIRIFLKLTAVNLFWIWIPMVAY